MLANTLISIALKASLLLSLALLVASIRAWSAAARHLILLAGLLASLVLPALSLSLPELSVPLARVALESHYGRVDGQVEGAAGDATLRDHGGWIWLGVSLMLLWAAGTSVQAGRTIASWRALARVVQRARPVQTIEWRSLLEQCCGRMSMSRPRLLCSDETQVAFATGWLQPTIVIPAATHDWPGSRRCDVLLHELSHIERRDASTHFLAQLARDLYFWNPLALLAERRLCEQREHACDDRVLSCGQAPEAYAATLVDVAESLVTPADPVAPAMATQSSFLEDRIRAVLDVQRQRDHLRAGNVAGVLVPTLALLLPLAALRASEADASPPRLDRRSLADWPSHETQVEPPVATGTVVLPLPRGAVSSGVTFGAGSGGDSGRIFIMESSSGAAGHVRVQASPDD